MWVKFDIARFQVTRFSNSSFVKVSDVNVLLYLPSHVLFCPILLFALETILMSYCLPVVTLAKTAAEKDTLSNPQNKIVLVKIWHSGSHTLIRNVCVFTLFFTFISDSG